MWWSKTRWPLEDIQGPIADPNLVLLHPGIDQSMKILKNKLQRQRREPGNVSELRASAREDSDDSRRLWLTAGNIEVSDAQLNKMLTLVFFMHDFVQNIL